MENFLVSFENSDENIEIHRTGDTLNLKHILDQYTPKTRNKVVRISSFVAKEFLCLCLLHRYENFINKCVCIR